MLRKVTLLNSNCVNSSDADLDEKEKEDKYDDKGVDQEHGLKKLIDSEEESSEEENKEEENEEEEETKEEEKKKKKKEGINEPCHNWAVNMRTTKVQISLHSRISTFIVHCLDNTIPLLAIAEISRL